MLEQVPVLPAVLVGPYQLRGFAHTETRSFSFSLCRPVRMPARLPRNHIHEREKAKSNKSSDRRVMMHHTRQVLNEHRKPHVAACEDHAA